MLSPGAVLFAVPLLGAALAAQTTWVVNGGGTALQTAINTAVPGDILDVQPGVYSPVICTKGLQIVLRPGADIGQQFNNTIALSVGPLPATETFVLTGSRVWGISVAQCAGGVTFDSTLIGWLSTTPLGVQASSGPIVFDNVNFHYSPQTAKQIGITNCTQVSFTQCQPPALTVSGSSVSLSNCVVAAYGFGVGTLLQSGSVTVNGGSIAGSTTASWPVLQPGIQIDGGTLTVTGGATIQPSPAAVFLGIPVAAIAANGGTIRRDPNVTLLGTGIGGPAPVDTTPVPSVTANHAATSMSVTVRGEPGSAVFTFGGLPRSAYATPWGEAWLLPTDPVLHAALVPGSGTMNFAQGFASVPPWVVVVVIGLALCR
jgi:hypothetical protein